MANEAQPVSNLGSLSASTANTKLVVNHTYSNGQSNTLLLSVANSFAYIPGPYANDAVANTNGVGVKSPYYDASGALRIRLT